MPLKCLWRRGKNLRINNKLMFSNIHSSTLGIHPLTRKVEQKPIQHNQLYIKLARRRSQLGSTQHLLRSQQRSIVAKGVIHQPSRNSITEADRCSEDCHIGTSDLRPPLRVMDATEGIKGRGLILVQFFTLSSTHGLAHLLLSSAALGT